jgi:hypothetical protein
VKDWGEEKELRVGHNATHSGILFIEIKIPPPYA